VKNWATLTYFHLKGTSWKIFVCPGPDQWRR